MKRVDVELLGLRCDRETAAALQLANELGVLAAVKLRPLDGEARDLAAADGAGRRPEIDDDRASHEFTHPYGFRTDEGEAHLRRARPPQRVQHQQAPLDVPPEQIQQAGGSGT